MTEKCSMGFEGCENPYRADISANIKARLYGRDDDWQEGHDYHAEKVMGLRTQLLVAETQLSQRQEFLFGWQEENAMLERALRIICEEAQDAGVRFIIPGSAKWPFESWRELQESYLAQARRELAKEESDGDGIEER